MIFAVIAGLSLMALLILLSSRLAQVRTLVARQAILRVLVILLFVIGVFFWLRYRLIIAVRCNPDCIGANLVGWDLEDTDLRNSDFAEANLRGANLSVADLYNADFSGANLTGVNFQNANLRSTRFVGALLANANFRGAVLGDTDLRGAEITGADLTQVDFRRVYLDGGSFDRAKLVEANFSNKNLAGVSFVRADLTRADLSNADLSGSRLSGANLSGARLAGSNLAGAWLNLADLTGADLRGANLAGAQLIGANLSSANLNKGQLSGASLIGTRINGANLNSADLTDTRLLANELFPIDLLTDPLLQELNELQLLDMIADADFSGVRFNRQTKWPTGRTSILEELLGARFLEYALPVTNAQGTDPLKPTLIIAGNDNVLLLSQAIYTRFLTEGNTQSILLDSISSTNVVTAFCTDRRIHLVAMNRLFDDDAILQCSANDRNLVTFDVGIQALAVVVHSDNDFVDNLTSDQLALLVTSNRWSDVELSWPRMPLTRFVPDLTTIPIQFWIEKIWNGDVEAAGRSFSTVSPTISAAQMVQGVISDPYAIGIFDYGAYRRSGSALRLLPIDGQTPNRRSISRNTYRFTLPVYLHADVEQISQLPELQDFLAYYFDHAHLLTDQAGLFPAAQEVMEENKVRFKALLPKGD